MKNGFLFFTCVFFMFSCSKLKVMGDNWAFATFGITLFTEANLVSLKEIHLDKGNLLGREVVIEGTVINTGSPMTHLVVRDDTARILVVLNRIPEAESLLHRNSKVENWRILGTVERGKKGLPILIAQALSIQTTAGEPISVK